MSVPSPRERGAALPRRAACLVRGSIPAGAGSTWPLATSSSTARDHPHGHGEQSSPPSISSPPRARGADRAALAVLARNGTIPTSAGAAKLLVVRRMNRGAIPAYAGSRTRRADCATPQTNHPSPLPRQPRTATQATQTRTTPCEREQIRARMTGTPRQGPSPRAPTRDHPHAGEEQNRPRPCRGSSTDPSPSIWGADRHAGQSAGVGRAILARAGSGRRGREGEVALLMTGSSVSRAVGEASPGSNVDGFGQQLGVDR